MVDVELLGAAAGENPAVVARVVELTNEVYAVAEEGLWADRATRTSADEVVELIHAGEIAVARLDGRIVGCVRVQRLDADTGEFGMLTADPAHRGIGIGGELIEFAERVCRDAALGTMQLE